MVRPCGASELVRVFINIHLQFILLLVNAIFRTTSETVNREKERNKGAVNSVLANRITVVCQPVRVDTGRDVAVVAA